MAKRAVYILINAETHTGFPQQVTIGVGLAAQRRAIINEFSERRALSQFKLTP